MIFWIVGLYVDLCMFYVFKVMDVLCCIENDLVELVWFSLEFLFYNENFSSIVLFDWKW